MSIADDILREIAESNPIRFNGVLYGQGGGGDECRYCGAIDGYTDAERHKPTCQWVRARQALGQPILCGIDGCTRWLGHELDMNRGPQHHCH